MKPAAASSPSQGQNRGFAQPPRVLSFMTSFRSMIEGLKGHLEVRPARDEAIEKLERKLEELSQQNAIKDRMLAIVSHDMRSPLDSLKSLILLVSSRNISQGELQQAMAGLNHQVDQLSHFLDNILRWVKNHSAEIKPEFHRLPLHHVVKETVELLKLQARRKNIFIYDNIPVDVTVFADEEMIKLVLRNLMTNAIKFCHSNDSIHIQAREQESKVMISVQDTGRGMSKLLIPTLFELSHLSVKGTKNEVGIGLGLTLCKEFVEKMGGTITATSVEGKGSCFEFSLHSPTSPTLEFQRLVEMHENPEARKPITC